MMRHQRGAARVSLVWMIAVVVVLLVALAWVFVAYEEASVAEQAAADARAAAEAADARQATESEALTALSRRVGWYDRDAAVARTNVDAMTASMDELRATFPDIGEDVTTMAGALPAVTSAYNARGQEIAQLKDSLASLESEKRTLEQSLRDALAQKDTELGDLRRQLEDDAQNAQQQQAELQTRVDALRSQNSDLDAEKRQLEADVAQLSREQEKERSLWETRVRAMSRPLAFLQEPEAPDGKILSVSDNLALGWIDVGSRNRLARGTRFRVVSGSPTRPGVKAWAEVVRVEPGMAEVRFYDLVDRFDPIVPGDVVFNPVYDPAGERNAVLLGRFSGRFSERELEALLEDIGIQVQESLGITTDYLIVGQELYTDQETGEPLEEPLQPSDLAVYKEAEAQGVQIVPLKDLYAYFKY